MTALHALCAAIAAHEPGLFTLIYGRLVHHGATKDGMNGQPIVILPAVEEIGLYAFYGCTSLATVEFPGGLQEIGWAAFNRCTNLVAVEFPNRPKSFYESAFDPHVKIRFLK